MTTSALLLELNSTVSLGRGLLVRHCCCRSICFMFFQPGEASCRLEQLFFSKCISQVVHLLSQCHVPYSGIFSLFLTKYTHWSPTMCCYLTIIVHFLFISSSATTSRCIYADSYVSVILQFFVHFCWFCVP